MAGWRDATTSSALEGADQILPWIPVARKPQSLIEFGLLALMIALALLLVVAGDSLKDARRIGRLRKLFLARHRVIRAPFYQSVVAIPPILPGV